MNPTSKQQEAIDFVYGNCLVSAGAGSGKTETLSERALHLVEGKHCTPKQLLVLTFTEKAAAEMKERIRHKIASSTHPEVKAMADEVEQASICTFDSFANSLLMEHYEEVGLPLPPSIQDEFLFKTEERRIFDELVEQYSKKAIGDEADGFRKFCSIYCRSSFDTLYRYVNALLSLGELSGDKDAFLSTYGKKYLSEGFVASKVKDYREYGKSLLRDCLSLAPLYANMNGSSTSDRDVEDIQKVLETYESLKPGESVGFSTGLRTATRKELNPEDKAIRSVVSAEYKQACAMLSGSDEDLVKQQLEALELMRPVLELTKELNDRLDSYKRVNSAFTFSDIAYFARKVASLPEVKKKLQERYRFIMVDEFQDTSNLQMELLRQIANNNLFCVGDIKQSIYRFRNANPDLFLSMMADCEHGKGKLISLDDNFRSRPQIINGLNDMFSSFMSKDFGGVDYSNGQALNPGADYYDDSSSPIHGFALLDYDPSIGNQFEEMARAIGEDIKSIVASKTQVACPKDKKHPTRDADYSDFAILVSRKNSLPVIMKVFSKMHIPFSPTIDTSTSRTESFLTACSLVEVLDCLIRGDESSFAFVSSALGLQRSYLCPGFDDEAIHELARKNDLNSLPIVAKIKSIMPALRGLPVQDALQKAFDELGFYDNLAYVEKRRENLQALLFLLSLASSFDSSLQGFSEFAEFLRNSDKSEAKVKVCSPSEKLFPCVKGMSVHASKGLEFTYVYLADLERSYTKGGGGAKIVSCEEYGLLPSKPFGSSTFLQTLTEDSERKKAISEKIRLLYVAITRAKERLTFVRAKPKEGKGPYSGLARFAKSDADIVDLMGAKLGFLRPFPKAKGEADEAMAKRIEPNGFFRELPKLNMKVSDPRLSYSRGQAEKGFATLLSGTDLHKALELTSFTHKVPAEGISPSMRRKIEAVLRLPVFARSSEAEEYHEYRFKDQDGNSGVVDMFLSYPDHIDLFDFKSYSLDDEAYIAQVLGYKKSIERIFGKKVEAYLLSVQRGVVKKVS